MSSLTYRGGRTGYWCNKCDRMHWKDSMYAAHKPMLIVETKQEKLK